MSRLTAGAGNEEDPSCSAGGALTFTNVEFRRDIWSLQLDGDHGELKGAPERITDGGRAHRENPSLSSDGRYVAFASNQQGLRNIWLRELATGKESPVGRSQFLQRYPAVDASGGRIAYAVYRDNKRFVYVTTPGGVPEKLCEGCLRATDWSRDQKSILVFEGAPFRVDALDVASHRQAVVVKHATWNLLYGRFSPDNRWVSFTARTQPGRGVIMIGPFDGGTEGTLIQDGNIQPSGRAARQ